MQRCVMSMSRSRKKPGFSANRTVPWKWPVSEPSLWLLRICDIKWMLWVTLFRLSKVKNGLICLAQKRFNRRAAVQMHAVRAPPTDDLIRPGATL